MTTINGKKFLTIHAEADTVYSVDYVTTPTLNFLNATDGNIFIGTQGDFPNNEDDTAGHFLTVPSGGAVNSVAFPIAKCYVKASESGDIVIERCR